jgi:tetratricopeptide (TPR) repeat protein
MVQLGENIRINVELIDGENNSTLWGESYTRPRSAVYELEETLSKEIADALGIQLTGEEEERLTQRYTENSAAQEAYLKGYFETSRGRFQEALPHFEEAIEKDPNYAPAYAALARVYLFARMLGMPDMEALPKAEELAMTALKLDNTLAEAHTVLGGVQGGYYWNWVEAEKEYQLAIELDPNAAQVHNSYAHHLGYMGRFDEAIPMMKRAQQLDPSAIGLRVSSAMLFFDARRYEESIEQLQVVVDLQPNLPNAYRQLARVYEVQELYEQAATALHKSLVLEGASEEEVAGLLDASALGAEAYWRWQLDYERERAKREHVESDVFAIIYAYLGEKEEAFEWLEKAFEEGVDMSSLKVTPRLDPLRDDPRFQDLLRRMNLEP